MPKPQGYQKVLHLMELAEQSRSKLPILTFVDAPNAANDEAAALDLESISELKHLLLILKLAKMTLVMH
jgi:acetyl-CoA carboxylase alpha subunit